MSVSLERLGVTAVGGGDAGGAASRLERAAGLRRGIREREPEMVDLVEELAVTPYLLASVNPARDEDLRTKVKELLEPFAAAGVLTRTGVSVLSWARADDAAG